MKIKSMTATFGALKNARLEPGDGLTILEAPNEGGKSTWCAFLRAMFYGVPTRERDRQDYIAEKNRYQPWSGGAMEGAMELSWRGRDMILRRGPKGNTPFGAFSAVYADTGDAVPGLTGENCGETLLGVSREVFERSAFIGQGGAAIGANSELERRIAALVSSGEEEVSYSGTEGRLREWLRRRKHNKTGLIPKLENELSVLDDTISLQRRSAAQAEEAEAEIAALTARRQSLSASLELWRGRENQARLARYEEAQSALAAARKETEILSAELHKHGEPPARDTLRRAQEDLAFLKTVQANLRLAEGEAEEKRARAKELRAAAADPLFSALSAEEAWRTASEDAETIRQHRLRGEKLSRAKLLPALCAAAVGGALIAGGYFLLPAWFPASLALGLAIFAVGAAAGFFLVRRAAAGEKAKADGLLARYGAEYPDDILAKANAYRERCVCAREGERAADAVEEERARLFRQREELSAGLLKLVHSFEPGATDTFGVSAAISRALNLGERLATAQVRLEGAQKLADSLPKPDAVPVSPTAEEPEADFDPREAAAALAAADGELSRAKSALAMARGELNTLGDPDLFLARREELAEELARRREEYDAITLALEGLSGAENELRERFSPALNAAAGRFLAALTGGKYGRVTLSREFDAMAQEAASALPRRALALSQGTAEQVYLAARLAVCELALPAEEPAPLVLDDALDAFDDTRMALALELFKRLGAQRQILLFTCHGRERGCCAGAENVLTLSLNAKQGDDAHDD